MSKDFKETLAGNHFSGGYCFVEISKPSKQAAESCRLTSISHMLKVYIQHDPRTVESK